jgi:hypothetical protein
VLDQVRIADCGKRASDDRPHAGADDDVDGDPGSLQGAKDPDVSQTSRGATAEGEADAELESIAHQKTQVTCLLDQA